MEVNARNLKQIAKSNNVTAMSNALVNAAAEIERLTKDEKVMSTQNERLLAAFSATEKLSESIGESEWFSAEALSDFGKPFISPSDARFIAECSPKVVSSLLSRIEWLEAEKHSWKTYAAGLNSRIDALSKDADNLTKLLIEARDDVCECLNSDYLHAGWPRYDKRILFRHLHLSAIDAAISEREGE